MNTSNCMVTGGAGFIGSELVRQLAADGNKVVVVDNLVNGRRENLDDLSPELVRLEVSDIRGVRHSIHSPAENHDVNATGTLSMLIAARDVAVKRFVYVSSSEVYESATSDTHKRVVYITKSGISPHAR